VTTDLLRATALAALMTEHAQDIKGGVVAAIREHRGVYFSAKLNDLYQDVRCTICQDPEILRRFLKKSTPLGGYVCSVAFHVACKRIESTGLGWLKLSRRREIPLDEVSERPRKNDELPLAEEDVEPLLGKLAPGDRLLIEARFGLGSFAKRQSLAEIASHLGVSVATAQRRVQRALKKLRGHARRMTE
jgi:RNA polymerase sigma factor (sigma-70 family)